MKIVLGADHGGFDLKESLKKFLSDEGYEVDDKGNKILDNDDDYTDFAEQVAKTVGKEGAELGQKKIRGVLACRSAAGMVIAANKIKGIRAVAVFDETSAQHSREHNDANVIALSGDWMKEDVAKKILKTWLETEYSNEERHTRRLKKIQEMEK
jgi:ribose 5-phosphate isomerase B